MSFSEISDKYHEHVLEKERHGSKLDHAKTDRLFRVDRDGVDPNLLLTREERKKRGQERLLSVDELHDPNTHSAVAPIKDHPRKQDFATRTNNWLEQKLLQDAKAARIREKRAAKSKVQKPKKRRRSKHVLNPVLDNNEIEQALFLNDERMRTKPRQNSVLAPELIDEKVMRQQQAKLFGYKDRWRKSRHRGRKHRHLVEAAIQDVNAKRRSANVDLWEVSDIEKNRHEKLKDSFLEPVLQPDDVATIYRQRHERRKRQKITSEGEGLSRHMTAPAIDPSELHSGLSYRPDEKAHQDILRQELDDEIREQKVRQSYQKTNYKRPEFNHGMYLVPGSATTVTTTVIDQQPSTKKKQTQAKPGKRKSRAARNKEKRERREAYERALMAVERRKSNQLSKLDKIIATVEQEHRQLKQQQVKKAKKQEFKKQQTPKLSGSKKVAQIPRPFILSDEIPSALNQLEPQSNLFADRFVRFQQRQLIEGSVNPRKKKRRVRTKLKQTRAQKQWREEDFLSGKGKRQ